MLSIHARAHLRALHLFEWRECSACPAAPGVEQQHSSMGVRQLPGPLPDGRDHPGLPGQPAAAAAEEGGAQGSRGEAAGVHQEHGCVLYAGCPLQSRTACIRPQAHFMKTGYCWTMRAVLHSGQGYMRAYGSLRA